MSLMYSRMSGGNWSHRSVYSRLMLGSLLVRWFFNCRPAAIRDTSLHWCCTIMSESAFRKPGRLEAAACSRYVFAIDSSFLSARGWQITYNCNYSHNKGSSAAAASSWPSSEFRLYTYAYSESCRRVCMHVKRPWRPCKSVRANFGETYQATRSSPRLESTGPTWWATLSMHGHCFKHDSLRIKVRKWELKNARVLFRFQLTTT